MKEDITDKARVPHYENIHDRILYHPGYEITYCKCGKPIIHSREVRVDNCGRKDCD